MQPHFFFLKPQYNCVFTNFYKKIDKPPIKISIARIFPHIGQWKSTKWGGGGTYMVSCNFYSNVSSWFNATWQSFEFLEGDIYYQSINNLNKKQSQTLLCTRFFLKEREKVYQKTINKQKTFFKNQQN
jgi:hypothetical protein